MLYLQSGVFSPKEYDNDVNEKPSEMSGITGPGLAFVKYNNV